MAALHTTLDLPAGQVGITARARDYTGATQPERPANLWNPAGYNTTAWHRIWIDAH